MQSTQSPDTDLANHGPEIERVTIIFYILATSAVVTRLISRKLQNIHLRATDYTIVLGLLIAWGSAAVTFIALSYGLGKHTRVLTSTDVTKLLQLAFASEILYSINLPIVKISILLLYRSIFPTQGFALATNVVGAVVIAWGTACLLVSIFSCVPVRGYWDLTTPAKCINTRKFFMSNAIPNIITDIVILALPMGKVWHLQMSRGRRLAVSGMFLLGGFVCVASGIRLRALLSITSDDLSWSWVGNSIWSSVEIPVSVICACLPTLRPFLQYTFSNLTLLVSSAIKPLRSGRDSIEPMPKDTTVLASRDTAGAFKRLPDPHINNAMPLSPVKPKIGQTETPKWDVDAERGTLFDDRDNLLH